MSIIGGVVLGNLTDYLFFFSNGSTDANWQGATKGFLGNVAVDGVLASERTSGGVPYAGTIYTNDNTLSAWQNIINQNPTQAIGVTNQVARIAVLNNDLTSAINQITAMPATPGFTSVSSTSLNGLNTQNGINEVFVINITSGLNFSSKINITGDAGDVYILRWDNDLLTPGYQGQVKPQSGGAIVPHGGLKATNFINVAGDINSSGGGSNPAAPYPQGPRYNDGQGNLIIGGSNFNGGGFFTGYWLTTGKPDIFDPVTGIYYGETSSLSNGIFVGGWYSLTTKFSMTSGTSGVYITPNPATLAVPSINVKKYVSPDGGINWYDAETAPGPFVIMGTNPQFKYVVTNDGNAPLINITLTDNVYGIITIPTTTLNIGESFEVIETETWQSGQHTNIATVKGEYNGQEYTDSDPANYFGTTSGIQVIKYVSPDNGVTWLDANVTPGPSIAIGTNPQFKYVVTNIGNTVLTDITLIDSIYGPITIPTTTLAVSEFFEVIQTETWESGQHTNVAVVTGDNQGITYTDSDPANYFGIGPEIEVIKYVSPDNGVTWLDANTAPGPNIIVGTDPQFKYVVTNIGNTILENVTLIDNLYGPITIPTTTLTVGQTFEVITTESWENGQHTNIATVTGEYNGQEYTDSDPANYFGLNVGINIIKYVSPDNGVTWLDANTPPGPNIVIGTDPQFKYVVTNIGNVTLNNVMLIDDVYGSITIPTTTLIAGQTFEVITTESWENGQHTNIATVTGEHEGQEYTDSDPANYFGISLSSIQIVKYISVDNGVTWLDANTPPGPLLPNGVIPKFKFVITNTGETTLFDIQVTDNVLGLIGTLTSLAPNATHEWIIP